MELQEYSSCLEFEINVVSYVHMKLFLTCAWIYFLNVLEIISNMHMKLFITWS